jgi:hypothetical protein
LHLASIKNLGDYRVDGNRRRAKIQGFAPGMWDPREVEQNAKLIAQAPGRVGQRRSCRNASHGD